MRELILASLRIAELAVQLPRLETNGLRWPRDFMALLALIGIGDQIMISALPSVIVDPRDISGATGQLEHRLGLLVVPDVCPASPTVRLMRQDSRFDET